MPVGLLQKQAHGAVCAPYFSLQKNAPPTHRNQKASPGSRSTLWRNPDGLEAGERHPVAGVTPPLDKILRFDRYFKEGAIHKKEWPADAASRVCDALLVLSASVVRMGRTTANAGAPSPRLYRASGRGFLTAPAVLGPAMAAPMGRACPYPLTAFFPTGAIMTTVSRFLTPLLAAAALLLTGAGAGPGAALADPLKVAVNKDDRPFGYVDDQGRLSGFNVDLARALCRAMAADCTLTPVPFSDFVPGVAEGRFDFAVANLLRTPEREQLVDFTDRIWRSSSAFVGRPGAVTDIAPEGLRGKTIAVQAGASQERYLREVYGDTATILAFPTNVERNAALAAGKADLMLGSITACFMFLKSPEGATFEIVGQPLRDRGLGGDVAVPVAKKRDALRQRLNAAITDILRDGTFSRINNAYFPVSVY